LEAFLLTVATLAAMFAIVPLMIWGGTGSWRHAWEALKMYLGILGVLALIGGGLGLVMVLATIVG
jgi:hypothetical protein